MYHAFLFICLEPNTLGIKISGFDLEKRFNYLMLLFNNVATYTILLFNDMGRDFSFLIKELYRYILEDIFEIKSDFTITDNTVMFRFRES
jgi:hypothetical protein